WPTPWACASRPARTAERRSGAADGLADGGADVVVHGGRLAGEGRDGGDDDQEDQGADQAVFNGRGAAVVTMQPSDEFSHPALPRRRVARQSRPRSQAISGSSAGGMG